MVAFSIPFRKSKRMAVSSLTQRFRSPGILPGFHLTLGYALVWLGLIVLFPLTVLVLKASGLGLSGIITIALQPRILGALQLSFGAALVAAAIGTLFGLLLAWVLVRYRFPGRRFFDAIVDLPFALPTAVAGIALAAIYAPNGWIGAPLAALGLKVAFTRAGILVALVFIGLPFVVRTVEPLIAGLEQEVEEASATLGASRRQTFFRVLLPALAPALITGFAMAFARCVGEYGSVIFIAGNLPYVSEIAPLLIIVKLEEYDYAGATAIATIMLAASFMILLLINLVQSWTARRFGHV
jgi:sulfate/thiosulfate transport system permease protein